MIQGLNGRVYDSTGKRIDSASHPELRSDRELRAAAQARAPKQPTGIPDPNSNPHRRLIADHVRFKGAVWAKSQAGRDWIVEQEAAADEWDQQRSAAIAEQERIESVRPLSDHAAAQVQLVLDDENESVESCELALVALEAAKRGDRAAYVEWERQRNEQRTQRLAEQLAEKEIDMQRLRDETTAIRQSAIDYQAQPIPEIAPPPQVHVDRSKAIIERRVPVGANAYRVEREIIDV